MNWLRDHNPDINWTTGQLEFKRCPTSCGGIANLKGNINNLIDETQDFSDNQYEVNEIRHQIFAYQTMATKLATENFHKDERPTLEQILKGPYADFVDVFGEEGTTGLPPRRSWDHAIDFESDWKDKKWRQRVYPLSPKEQVELDNYLKKGLDNGTIKPSKSELASPFFFVAKKGGELRPIVDYRKLNDITVKNKYPLPLVPELVDKWKGCKYFTKLDVRGAFNNIRIKKGDEWKTAFTTNRGLYESLVMNFGLVNAPATFQTMMNDIFIVYIRRGDTSVYVDDVIIGTRQDPEGKLDDLAFHEKSVREILEVFREHNLYLKPEKCEFSKKQVEYLGFVITGDHVMMDPIKVDGVSSWPTPTNLKQLRSFIGFINFYRRFIRDFSSIARPLYDLTMKDKEWDWSPICQAAFDKLKETVCTTPVLAHPDPEKPYLVECDASDFAMGAVLSQKLEDGKWHPVAFMSKSFKDEQEAYEIHDKELLAIMTALREWRHFLVGAKHKTEVLTDHNNLLYFRNAQKLKPRQARWALELEEFDIILKHRPGRLSGKPDALSRRADHGEARQEPKEQTLLGPELFANINMVELRSEFDVQIHEEQHRDPLIHDLMKKLEGEVTGWDQKEGLWRYHGKIYIPECLRREVFDAHHASPAAGHPGIKASIDAISRYYYWPNCKDDIEQRVKNCDTCQRIKPSTTKPPGQLKPTQIPSHPWDIISMDLITGLPESAGMDSILVVVDRFSKMVILIACNSTLDALGTARLLHSRIWSMFGKPRLVISDRGPQFASKFTQELASILGIKLALSSAYHPQTDGQTERMNQEIEKYLRAFVSHQQNDWANWLPSCQFAMNNTVKSSTGFTPFELNFGRHPNPGSAPAQSSSEMPALEKFVKDLNHSQETAKKALEKTAETMKRFADKKRGSTPDYTVGQLVMLSAANLSTTRPSKKLADKWHGPFEILEKVGTHNYRLKLPEQWRIHPVFHVEKLKPYNQDQAHPNHPLPPPDLIDQEEEYEVEKILDAQYRRGILNYLVKWVGYPNSEASWLRADNTEHMDDLVDDWYKDHPDSPRSLRPERKKPTGPRTRKGKVKFMGHSTPSDINFEDIKFQTRDTTEVNAIAWPTGRLTIANLQVKLLSPNAKMPTRGSELAAGYDLSSAQALTIQPGQRALVQTDISVMIPQGTYARIAPRSGLALKNGINVGAGVVDGDYTGPVGVVLFNHGSEVFKISVGDRIAQLILERIRTPPVTETKELASTSRGASGFGSTGTTSHSYSANGSGPLPSS